MRPKAIFLAARLGRAELRGWTLLVAGLAYWGNVVRTVGDPNAQGAALVVDGVLEHGAFPATAWLMIAALTRRGAPAAGTAAEPAGRREIAAAIAICLLCALPTRQATMAALVLLGLPLARAPAGGPSRAVAALLLGLAGEIAWTSIYALPLHAAAARFDAVAVRGLLALAGIDAAGQGNVVDNPAENFGIEILAPCASSFPLAGIVLAFLVVVLHEERWPGRPFLIRTCLPWLAASALASVALTELRLSWMAAGEADYAWLHQGGGVTLYTLAAVGFAALFPLLATRAPALRRAVA